MNVSINHGRPPALRPTLRTLCVFALCALLSAAAFARGGGGRSAECCDDCCDHCGPDCCEGDAYCGVCCRVCEEKTTKKWIYGCKEKFFCQTGCPRLFGSEECVDCESTPRVKRVLMKKQVSKQEPHVKCVLVKPESAAPKASPEEAVPAVPPAPPTEKPAKPAKTAAGDSRVTRTSGSGPRPTR